MLSFLFSIYFFGSLPNSLPAQIITSRTKTQIITSSKEMQIITPSTEMQIITSSTEMQGLESVKLAVYYESMCPDSDNFFHQQLLPTYEKLSDYLEVELIPYGNAHYKGRPDNYEFTCQHGAEECYGNMAQSCFITLVNNTFDQIRFINCAFEVHRQMKTLEKCIDNLDLRRQVKKCVTTSMGGNILYQMAKKTDALKPPHTFIPWITINGKGGKDLNDRANQDLLSAVCNEFLNNKPAECGKTKSDKMKMFRYNYL